MFKRLSILSLLVFFVPVHRTHAVSPCPSLKEFPPLHAEEDFIYDSSGRVALLHGVNVPANYLLFSLMDFRSSSSASRPEYFGLQPISFLAFLPDAGMG